MSDNFIKNLPFEVSRFQEDAFRATENEKHVLVTAHTGSGKTLPAEFAIYYFTSLGKKVIYTSPIKALSNQKFEEFTNKFSDIDVGIMTGDIKHNPNADLLIMTTEILQNYLFKKRNNISILDFDIDIDNELECVIFDEVHYIDDPDRGTVWEQCMIMLPNHVKFVMLSATIGQKEVFAKWIQNIKQRDVVICHTDRRVVPLYFYDFFTCSEKYIENKRDKTWKELLIKKKGQFNLIKSQEKYNTQILDTTRKCLNEISKDNVRVTQKFVLNECLVKMRDEDMFPCLVFVFSRKRVESLAKDINIPLFLENEKDYKAEPVIRQLIVSRVTNWKEYIALPEYEFYVNLLEKGIAIHHAGMLPIFREVIEILYDKKYIKCLIATETFAIGLNMPTRSVVFTSLYKNDGNGIRKLKSHEFIQMAGRAGRRNIDSRGNVIILSNLFDPLMAHENEHMFSSNPKVIKSKYKINFTLILNYVMHFSEEDFTSFIKKSMMYMDILNEIEEAKLNIMNHTHQKDKYISSLSYDLDVMKDYHELCCRYNNSYNKQKRKFNQEIEKIRFDNRDIHRQYMSYYLEYIKHETEIQENLKYKQYAETYIDTQIQSIYRILKDNGFINDDKKLTDKGMMACNIHEINNLVFSDFYEVTNGFQDYDAYDMAALISIFYDVKISDDKKSFLPDMLHKDIKTLNSLIDKYRNLEDYYQISTSNNYNVQFDMMKYVKEWLKNVKTMEEAQHFLFTIKQEKGIFIGDFIKCCLKICNICNELMVVGELCNNLEFVVKIQYIQQEIKKFIVSSNSLYV
jgi:antiviral helicase SKI2